MVRRHPAPAWVRPVCLRLRGRGLARQPSCGRAPRAVGESRVGWGAAARVPKLLASEKGSLAAGWRAPGPTLAPRLGPGGCGPAPAEGPVVLRRARAGRRPELGSRRPRGSRGPVVPFVRAPWDRGDPWYPVVPRGAGDSAQRLSVLAEWVNGSLEGGPRGIPASLCGRGASSRRPAGLGFPRVPGIPRRSAVRCGLGLPNGESRMRARRAGEDGREGRGEC